jgi:hypothetical protein
MSNALPEVDTRSSVPSWSTSATSQRAVEIEGLSIETLLGLNSSCDRAADPDATEAATSTTVRTRDTR